MPDYYDIREYLADDGRCPFAEWLEGLRDRKARARIDARLARARLGNLGDYASVGDGVYELRIFMVPVIACILVSRVILSCCSCVAAPSPRNGTT